MIRYCHEVKTKETLTPQPPENHMSFTSYHPMTDAEKVEALRAVVEQAFDQFDYYAKLHLAKTPPDEEKAKVNRNYADMCSAALNRTAP
jgi:hypothetical protein